jgi:Uma2 family endonuclease
MTVSTQANADYLFPDSDGKPMADNTEQFRWIVMIKENLEILFAADADVFIAGDLLWYPVQVQEPPVPSQAPDVMVAFGRPKGRRGSYRQWQEADIPPQVVFEILSPSNTRAEMARKFEFYQTYGVEEYYLYDPDHGVLKGWLRQGDRLVKAPKMQGWCSPRLGIRFERVEGELVIYRPDGQRFLSSVELAQRAEAERLQAETQRQRAEMAEQQAETKRLEAEVERQRAELAEQRAERLAAYLRAQGLDPDDLPAL